MTENIYTRTSWDPDEFREVYWASLDGENWIPVTREARLEDLPALRKLFAGDDEGFAPLTCSTSYIERLPKVPEDVR